VRGFHFGKTNHNDHKNLRNLRSILGNMLNKIHHIAIICSDYQKSKAFYTEILGFEALNETFRAERNSWKLDLALNGNYILELFSFPDSPKRPSHPEACGLRHLAFEVDDIQKTIEALRAKKIVCEDLRVDELTGKQFTFFSDPDNLPIEIYQG
jgi:glyoxylase I family protein